MLQLLVREPASGQAPQRVVPIDGSKSIPAAAIDRGPSLANPVAMADRREWRAS
jgi:hypothetical protein